MEEAKRDFWFYGMVALVFLYITTIVAMIILDNFAVTDFMLSLGAVLLIFWMISTFVLPTFVGLFVYHNYGPYWKGLFAILFTAMIVIFLDAAFIILYGCNNSIFACDNKIVLLRPFITIMLIPIFITVIIISIIEWRAYIQRMEDEKRLKVQTDKPNQ